MVGFKVLLVDDEVVFCENMSSLLNTRGYEVTAVSNGQSAISALEKDGFDIVVLDLKMPGMDGIAVMTEIKKLGFPTKVLVLTGHGSIDTAMDAIKLGAYDYLTKPCEVEELTAKIEEVRNMKGRNVKKDMNEKKPKPVESPKKTFSLFSRKSKTVR